MAHAHHPATLFLVLPRSSLHKRSIIALLSGGTEGSSVAIFSRGKSSCLAHRFQAQAFQEHELPPAMSDHPEVKQNAVLTDDDWKQKWESRNIGFHEQDVHPLLSEFVKDMVNGREKLKIFFPLCGKAVDMKWLADMGHTIVGVDVSEMGLKEFFEEQNVPYVEEAVPEIPGAKCFKSTSGNISLYCCNIYEISASLVGKFDGIWDRGALVAVNPIDREKYVGVMLPLLNKDCRYLAVIVEYDPNLHAGPPFYVTETDIKRLFGSVCSYKLLKKIDVFSERLQQWGLNFFNEKVYLVTPKACS